MSKIKDEHIKFVNSSNPGDSEIYMKRKYHAS